MGRPRRHSALMETRKIPTPRRGFHWGVTATVAALMVVLYAAGLGLVHQEYALSATQVVQGPRDRSFVRVNGTVMTIDAVQGTMMARLEFDPQGDLDGPGPTLARKLYLFVNGARGSREVVFEAGHPMSPLDVELMLLGETTLYPFDEHEGLLLFTFTEGAPDGRKPVPAALVFDAWVSGYSLDAAMEPVEPDFPGTQVAILVRRALSVRLYSVAVMALMLALAGTVVVMVRVFYVQHRKVEATLFSFYGAMLFAFPAMRNTMPGVPPMGALCDYAAFFWAEAIVAMALMSGAWCWAFLRPNVAPPLEDD